MPMINRIAEFQDEMAGWRQDIHAHPELGFEENRTADIVARELESFGLEVHRGLAKTGVDILPPSGHLPATILCLSPAENTLSDSSDK